MRLFVLSILGLGLGLSGCSLALDTDQFRGVDASGPPDPADGGGADAGPGDAGTTDVPVVVTALTPPSILEGLGDGHPSVRAAAFLIEGSGLAGAEVTASPQVVIADVRAAEDGTHLGLALRAPVDRDLPEGGVRTATLTVRRGDHVALVPLRITGLDELTLRAGDIPTPGAYPPIYSEIRIEGGRLSGLAEIRLLATARIDVQARLLLSGLSNREPGAGGCPGGEAARAANCGPRSGSAGAAQAGLDPSGGGGGGNQIEGGHGASGAGGLQPGLGGTSTRTSALTDGLRTRAGAGGGGGGSATSASGGGGGGALALVSHGVVALQGDVDISGGPGRTLTSGGCEIGGGGGGSGGVFVVRAWRLEGTATVDVAGGAGSAAPTCDNRGGAGGAGIVYAQTALEQVEVSTDPPQDVLQRGPAWAASTPVIVDAGTVTLDITGVPGVDYFVSVDDAAPIKVTVPSGGAGVIRIPLEAGLRTVCLATTRTPVDALEGRHCLDFAVLP